MTLSGDLRWLTSCAQPPKAAEWDKVGEVAQKAAEHIEELEAEHAQLLDAVHLALECPQERHVYVALNEAFLRCIGAS